MISLIKLYFRKDWPTIVTWVGILLVITLALSIIQMAGAGTIKVDIFGVGMLLGLIIPLAVLPRGKHGEGKCLSRLPMARYRIFLVQFIYGILVALAFMLLLKVGEDVIRGIVALSGYNVGPSSLLSATAWMDEIRGFARVYPAFVFLVAVVRWLEKWMNRDHALALVVLVPFVLLMIFLALMAVAKVSTITDGPSLMSRVVDWTIRYRETIGTVIYLIMLAGPLFIYRVRHFKSF